MWRLSALAGVCALVGTYYIFADLLRTATEDVRHVAAKISHSGRISLPLDALQLEGRMHYTGSTLQMEWPASSVRGRFRGESIAMEIELLQGDHGKFAVSLDGSFHSMVTINRTNSGPSLVTLATDLELDSEHEIIVLKATEPKAATASLSGFDLGANGKWMKRPPKRKRSIEVIGDSISCGYGVECASKNETDLKYKHENVYKSYAAIAARELSADLRIFAWSGKGLLQNQDGKRTGTMLDIMDSILPRWDPDLKVGDDDEWRADAVVVNLLTNDMAPEHQDSKEDLYNAVQSLVELLRKRPGTPLVILCLGPMIATDWPLNRPGDLDRVRRILRGVAQSYKSGVIFTEFPAQETRLDLPCGCSGHPGVKMHLIMAKILEDTLRQQLYW